MVILLNKFGSVLTSRMAGREAFAAFQPTLREKQHKEIIEIDFDGVLSFSPGWADEFITSLKKEYGSRVVLHETSNPSVKATLDILGLK